MPITAIRRLVRRKCEHVQMNDWWAVLFEGVNYGHVIINV
jgi:hypothetical protein